VEHLLRLRELQDETSGFQSFIPLPFHPANTELEHLRRTSAHDDLRTIAVSRLLLDNFDHVKSFWIMLGLKIAQLSLFFGADDLDGTVVEERITHAAGATTGQFISREGLLDLIREAGLVPVERDTLYNHLREYQEVSA
jgi:aminodeoxyfutalosine synthase